MKKPLRIVEICLLVFTVKPPRPTARPTGRPTGTPTTRSTTGKEQALKSVP